MKLSRKSFLFCLCLGGVIFIITQFLIVYYLHFATTNIVGILNERFTFYTIGYYHETFPHMHMYISQNNTFLNWSIPCTLSEPNQKLCLNAMQRAQSLDCRLHIAQVACSAEFDPSLRLKSFCPLREQVRALGCFQDRSEQRDLATDPFHSLNDIITYSMSISLCIDRCLLLGFPYAGLQFGKQCRCGHSFGRFGPSNDCDTPCSGNSSETCGGWLAQSIYFTGVGVKPTLNRTLAELAASRALHTTTPQRARVLYLLTLNGRNVRQVRRLIRALYHVNHYFLIHIDQRAEYLWRELSPLAAEFTNIRFTEWRLAPFWGSNSLLAVILHAIRDALSEAFSDWHWTHVINLSESDYPIRSDEELRELLSYFHNYSFLAGQSTDKIESYLRREGLEWAFAECDGRMWRVARRSLPRGIRLDGGSDWLVLSRAFARFVALEERDPLVSGLRQYFEHALLPAESFFHMVLLNSEFCTNGFLDNNLKITYWNREAGGCDCSAYQKYVDWCGCSPQVIRLSHLQTVEKLTKPRMAFFARKFDLWIDSRVYDILDHRLLNKSYGSSSSVLLNVFDHRDSPEPDFHLLISNFSRLHHLHFPATRDLQLSALSAIARLSLRSLSSHSNGSCELLSSYSARTAQPLSAHLYRLESEHHSGDHYQSAHEEQNSRPQQFLVAFQVGDNTRAVFEALVRATDESPIGNRNESEILGMPLSHLTLVVDDPQTVLRLHVLRRREDYLFSQPDQLALFCSSLLIRIRIGIDYDKKERIFRSLPGVIGPTSHVSVKTVWQTFSDTDLGGHLPKQCGPISLIFVDPMGAIVAVNTLDIFGDLHNRNPATDYTQRTDASAFSGGHHKNWSVHIVEPSLSHPLRPGFWEVIGLIDVDIGGSRVPHVLFEVPFLVTPHTQFQTKDVSEADSDAANAALNLVNGGPSPMMNQCILCARFQQLLHVTHSREERSTIAAEQTINHSHFHLDTLYSHWFSVDAFCLLDFSEPLQWRASLSYCVSQLPSCNTTTWSSFVFDPRSEFLNHHN